MTTENEGTLAFNDSADQIPADVLNPQVAEAEEAPATEETPFDNLVSEVEGQMPYQPNMKYKFEGKELPIDEFFKPLLTDENAEKRIRELSEISQAFPKYKETYEEYKQIAPQYQSLVTELQELGELRQTNLPEFLGKFNVQPQDILEQMDPALVKQHVAKLFALEDLTPEQRHAYNQQQQQLSRAKAYEVENKRLSDQLFERDVERKSFELEQSLGTADAKTMQAKFDSYYGNNAFKNEVIQTGQIAFKMSGRDITPQEAIQMVMKKYSPIMNAGSPQMVGTQTGNKVKVIPNVPTRPVSPGKQKPKSLDEIRKLADSMED